MFLFLRLFAGGFFFVLPFRFALLGIALSGFNALTKPARLLRSSRMKIARKDWAKHFLKNGVTNLLNR
jgi:hypothetical protein